MKKRCLIRDNLFVIILIFSLLSSFFVVLSRNRINIEEQKVETDESIETIDFSGINYVAFGDSITEGGGLESFSHSYPNVTAKLLGCNILNKGISGSTLAFDNSSSRHCIADDVVTFSKTGSRAHIISVSGGSNDKSNSLPLGTVNDKTTETIYGSLNIIADTLEKRFPDAFIFFITPIKHPNCESLNENGYNLLNICEAIKNVAAKHSFPVLDLYNTSQFETASNGMNHPDCDGWHPLKEFVADYMAPQVADFIIGNYNGRK